MNLKNHIQNLLSTIGLTRTEALVYLTILKSPKITFKQLEEKTKLSTATVYRAFEKLKGMGLLTSSQTSWKKNIEAVSLRSLGEKLAREQRKLRKVEIELKRLDCIFDLSQRSFQDEPVQVFQDKNSMLDHYYEILAKPWDHLRAYGSGEILLDIMGEKPEYDFVDIRHKKGRTADYIMTEVGPYGDEIKKSNNEKFLRNTKIKVDPDNQNFMTYIYGNEVAIIRRDKDLGDRTIFIRDPAIVQHYETMFSSIWSHC